MTDTDIFGRKKRETKTIFVCFCSFVIVTLNNTAQNSKFSKNLPSTWQQTVKEEKKMNAK